MRSSSSRIQLLFATQNENKVAEINSIVPPLLQIISLKDMGWTEKIPEPHLTLEENALEKASVLHNRLGCNCFSEDSGLFIDALNGAPGVHSARFASLNNDDLPNIDFALQKMKGKENRKAFFKTVICYAENNEYEYFTGICEGSILLSKTGNSGFGYDAIFKANGAGLSFGEMTLEQKNEFSHRKKATDLFIHFLQKKYGED